MEEGKKVVPKIVGLQLSILDFQGSLLGKDVKLGNLLASLLSSVEVSGSRAVIDVLSALGLMIGHAVSSGKDIIEISEDQKALLEKVIVDSKIRLDVKAAMLNSFR